MRAPTAPARRWALRAAWAGRKEPQGATAAAAVVMTAVVLLLVALLDPTDLTRWAKGLPEGWQRSTAVAATGWVPRVSHDLLLDRPRQALDELIHGSGPTRAASPSRPVRLRTPTPDQPLRVYIGGDSVVEAVGASFSRMASATGVIDTTVEVRYATGLSRPDYFDWPARLRQRLAGSPRPEVVIVMVGANDLQAIRTPRGYAAVGTTAWLAEYRRRAAAAMRELAHSGADVYWVGQPIMRDRLLSRRMHELDEIFASEAEATKGITYVSTWSLLADRSGRYATYLPDASGTEIRVRTPDGVHLTPAGGDRVARVLLRLIARRWHVARP